MIKKICKQNVGPSSLDINWLQQVIVSAQFSAICHLFGVIDTHSKHAEVRVFVAVSLPDFL